MFSPNEKPGPWKVGGPAKRNPRNLAPTKLAPKRGLLKNMVAPVALQLIGFPDGAISRAARVFTGAKFCGRLGSADFAR